MTKRLNILVVILLLFGLSITTQAQDDSSRFGIVEGFWYPDLTCELGVGWERIIFDWAQHQPESADDWHTLNVDDRWLKAASLCNREVVALLKNTPAWATDGEAGIGVPLGLDLPIDDAGNVWANFVRRTVDYYASRGVTHFIIWNEPDIDQETYGYEFAGDLDDYFQMLKVAYLAAKDANPHAVIHLAGTTYWHDVNAGRRPYMERLIERIIEDPEAAEHDYYFDVLSLHIYFRTETVYEIVMLMREMLDSHGLTDKAIWINETNAAPTDDPDWPVVRPQYPLDLTQQSAFLVQSAALALAADVERIAAYKLVDQGLAPGAESFGLLTPSDLSPRPAFDTWRMINAHFSDVESAELLQSETVDAVLLHHTDDRQTVIMWARTEQRVQMSLTATTQKAYQIDLYGNITVVRPDDGVYYETLPEASCNDNDGCFIGGVPLIWVQPAGEVTIRNETTDTTLGVINVGN